jgi:hypothetical protein
MVMSGGRKKSLRQIQVDQRADHTIAIATNPANAKLAIKENAPCKGWEWK